MSNTAKLIFDFPDRNPDLFYACRFSAPDPILFLQIGGKTFLFLNELEFDRGKKEAQVDRVLPLPELPNSFSRIAKVLKDKKIKTLEVHPLTGVDLVEKLRKSGIKMVIGKTPFFPKRLIKKPNEKKGMAAGQRTVFQAIRLAENILKKTQIRNNKLYWKGKVLTSEILRYHISTFLLQKGFYPNNPIVACHKDTFQPHNICSGALRPHKPIIIDIFPRSLKTGFYGDATRTFCRGKAPDLLKRQYRAVLEAQTWGLKNIRAGIDGQKIHKGICKIFEKHGFSTKKIGGIDQGFIHRTGHGLGLEIHELIRIDLTREILKPGFVVTIEPGLYYLPLGGVRIEDAVYLTKRGCEILGSYPKRFEIL